MISVVTILMAIGGVSAGSPGYNLPWSWDTVGLWGDISSHESPIFTDDQYKFMAENYDIISFEKCMGSPLGFTESNFYEAAAGIRKYSPSSDDTLVLFYWAIPECFCDCYQITEEMSTNASMWVYDDDGVPYGGKEVGDIPVYPRWDFTQQYVRDYWVNALCTVIKTALDQGIIVNGAFLDGLNNKPFSNMNDERQSKYDEGFKLVLTLLRQEFDKIDPNLFFIGNGLFGYTSFLPDYGLNKVPYVDGLCLEHYGSFEQVNRNLGTYDPDWFLTFIDVTNSIMDGDYGQNKSIFVKSWPGPVIPPFDQYGPSWPPAFGVRPTSNEELGIAAAEMLIFPLTVYLCGMYREGVYFGYSWFYDGIHGFFPCPEDPSSCSAPVDWYPEFQKKLGKPLGDGTFTNKYKCQRSFEYADIYVDLSDNTSAIINWYGDGAAFSENSGSNDNDSDGNHGNDEVVIIVIISVSLLIVIGITLFVVKYRKSKKKEDSDQYKNLLQMQITE